MNFRNKKTQSIAANLLIICMLASVISPLLGTQKAQAQFGWGIVHDPVHSGVSAGNAASSAANLGISIKEWAKEIAREVLRAIARRMLNQMTKSTLNWINSGFHGAPLFLENPESFFTDITKYEVKNFVDTIGYSTLRFPFGRDVALNTIYTYRRQATDNLQYSLSKVINDEAYLNSFRADFAVGGWDGFLLHTQYPQNNPIGFRMLAAENLSRRLDGVDLYSTPARQIQNTLQQGLGFLSPQNCPSNPSYDNTRNQFLQPRWNPSAYYREHPFDPPGEEGSPEYEAYVERYNNDYEAAYDDWGETNTCPGGLVSTTPGSVVGSQVAKALGGSQDQASLAAAMGNSISAILDAMLHQFLNRGLNALASTTNPRPADVDDWDYFGNTLGSAGTSNTNEPWDSGPDEVIVLEDFRREVAEGIANTIEEIGLMNNLAQTFSSIWPQVRNLDMCLPGPDIDWEGRLADESRRNGEKFLSEENSQNGERAALARLASRSLDFAVNFYEDWVKNQMLTILPNSLNYLEAIDGLEPIYQQSDQLTDKKRVKTQALARLRSIQTGLAAITVQPERGSAAEDVLISLRKQYKAVFTSISNSFSLEDTRNELNTAGDQLAGLLEMVNQCAGERANAGWSAVDTTGRGQSVGTDRAGRTGTEKELFCSFPIEGGYSHGEGEIPRNGQGTIVTLFVNPVNPPQYGNELPMLNADNVPYSWGFLGIRRTNVEVSCNVVFKANILDYKGSIPGVTGPIGEIPREEAGPVTVIVTPTNTVLPGALVKVAYDTVNQVYLAVAGHLGWFLDRNGAVIGSPFNITPESPSGNNPFIGWTNVAFGGPTSDPTFLVTYIASVDGATNNPKFGRLIRYSGGTPTISDRTEIVNVTSQWYASEKAGVVWSGSNFIVSSPVAATPERQPQVNFFRMDGSVSAGTMLGNGQDYQDPRGLACSGNVCVSVGWARRSPTRTNTYARLFNANTLAPIGSVFYLDNNTSTNEDQDVVFNQSTGRFQAAWAQDGVVNFRTISTSGTMGPLNPSGSFGDGVGDIKLSYNPSTGTTLLVTKTGPAANFRAIELGDDGSALPGNGALITSWDGTVPAYWPSIAANPDTSQWLVLYLLSGGYRASIVQQIQN